MVEKGVGEFFTHSQLLKNFLIIIIMATLHLLYHDNNGNDGGAFTKFILMVYVFVEDEGGKFCFLFHLNT